MSGLIRTRCPVKPGIGVRNRRNTHLTKKAAENGAKIVTFQEYAMVVNEEDESRLREQYKIIAKENNIFLSITYAYFAKEGKGENKHLLCVKQSFRGVFLLLKNIIYKNILLSTDSIIELHCLNLIFIESELSPI